MKKQSGFTLIELMIVVAIVAILAAVALPAYQNYTAKAKFTEVVAATGAAKASVELCYNNLSTLTGCSGGSNGIPANITTTTGNLASLSTTNGVITATAIGASNAPVNGLKGQTYILTPTITNNKVIWSNNASGAVSSCIADGVC
ncbi:prepilin-type N-terminal cleavage/methylation domain-containing protein [Aeromonas caviae]|uniref:pilin n=1 Tax=Aeromonas TaxID=642 RepID=UPI00214DF31A|nr:MULTISPECIES: prepilin-type N-terminal cleavage/methylation domain-containing protein [Aeromonas]MCR3892328.1 prepilin-type N-terminal cleavage/methylation domain-containing protein [Aeromonas caviae]